MRFEIGSRDSKFGDVIWTSRHFLIYQHVLQLLRHNETTYLRVSMCCSQVLFVSGFWWGRLPAGLDRIGVRVLLNIQPTSHYCFQSLAPRVMRMLLMWRLFDILELCFRAHIDLSLVALNKVKCCLTSLFLCMLSQHFGNSLEDFLQATSPSLEA